MDAGFYSFNAEPDREPRPNGHARDDKPIEWPELRLQSTAADCNYDEEGSNDLWGAAWDIEEKVVTTMPATMSGLLVQLRVAAMRLDMGVGPDDGGMLRGILAGAERLAGRA